MVHIHHFNYSKCFIKIINEADILSINYRSSDISLKTR